MIYIMYHAGSYWYKYKLSKVDGLASNYVEIYSFLEGLSDNIPAYIEVKGL